MEIDSKTTWTITDNATRITLDIQDVLNLLVRVLIEGHLTVFDMATGLLGEDADEVTLSLNGPAIQITLHKDEIERKLAGAGPTEN